MMEDSYMETADTAASCPPTAAQEGSKLPPVLANLMVSLNSNRSPPAQSNAPPPNNPAMNVQELLSSIMVRFPVSSQVPSSLTHAFSVQELIFFSDVFFRVLRGLTSQRRTSLSSLISLTRSNSFWDLCSRTRTRPSRATLHLVSNSD